MSRCPIPPKLTSTRHNVKESVFVAAEPGFEPGLEDPKSPVLPLHNSAITFGLYQQTAFWAIDAADMLTVHVRRVSGTELRDAA